MQCVNPILVTHPNGYKIKVPCGKCVNCKATNVQQWVQRLTDEMFANDVTYFVTLSYDDKNVQYVIDENGAPVQTLNRQDYTHFLQKLKYQCDLRLIRMRYFGCGEYGKSTSRPHYHFVLFFKFATGEMPNSTAMSQFILQNWTLGQINAAVPVTNADVFGYICKDMYKNHNRLLEDKRLQTFHTMSRRPAIGVGYVQNHVKFFEDAVKRRDRLVYVPRVYKKYLNLTDEDKQRITELNLLDDYAKRLQAAKARGETVDLDYLQILQSNKSLAGIRKNRIDSKKERF